MTLGETASSYNGNIMRDGLDGQLSYLIAQVNSRIEEELEEQLRPEGVPIEQLRILSVLAVAPTPMLQLADAVLVEGPTLTKMIDRMILDSLVIRAPDPTDRRRVVIHLTDRGRILHRRLSSIARKQQEQLFSRLNKKKVEQLQLLLRDLIDAPNTDRA
jgi:DNA-binding MarR family transcriptional regulator